MANRWAYALWRHWLLVVNVLLGVLTGHVFPAAFYAGDVLGSFNAWMRLLTGVLVSLGGLSLTP